MRGSPGVHPAVVGAGAVGSVLACALGGEAYSRTPGWRVVLGWGLSCRFPVRDVAYAGGPRAYLVLAVKAHQTPSALRALDAAGASPSVLVVAQNGFGGLELAESAGIARVVAGGVADFGASRRGWLVELRGPGRLLVGCRGRDCTWALRGLEARGPVAVEAVPDIEPWRWLKAAVNAAVNAITAARGVRNGAVLEDPGLYRLAHEVAGEVALAAELAGVRLPLDVHLYLDRVLEATAENESSTLQDLRECREPELPAIASLPARLLGAGARTLLAAYQEAAKAFRDRCGLDVPLDPRQAGRGVG